MDQHRPSPDGADMDDASSTIVNLSRPDDSAKWDVDQNHLNALTAMGFPPLSAFNALFYVKNESVDAAIEWILNHQDDLDVSSDDETRQTEPINRNNLLESSSSSLMNNEENAHDLYKMVFVVNSQLSMGTGKIAAQVAHATLGLHRLLLQQQNRYGESLLEWTEYGETKIVLKGDNTNHLVDLENQAINLMLPCYMVHDAGKTQVKAGSCTVLGIFGSVNQVNKVTGKLNLY
ncbi:putative peptidyl-tRNA hydrolase 2 [Sarcoptes scabiei]|uniref:peptidyl-tRNA hydrolase n=1 Tax=Sarcoptes scabiei TaxID=52283 RepID=A0A131ZTI3_SARSC|nr:putative peptidyl-tRNA hydrolase 2 [Sarcoptes scabiei]KPM02098.1 peptidyl-tRNA hydrolase 2-like protein [Sarcoptes scabiei]UXI21694.1 RAD21 protein [Sarcoptes scabiei]